MKNVDLAQTVLIWRTCRSNVNCATSIFFIIYVIKKWLGTKLRRFVIWDQIEKKNIKDKVQNWGPKILFFLFKTGN